jgi:hypothetical protein
MDRVVASNLLLNIVLEYRNALWPQVAEGGSGDITRHICDCLDEIRLIGRDLEQAQDSNTKTAVRRAISRAVKLCRSMKKVYLEGKCEPGVPALSKDDDGVDPVDEKIDPVSFKTASSSSALHTFEAQFSMITTFLKLISASRK